nr:hypothetical protein [Tanacetum cinerariifolium]
MLEIMVELQDARIMFKKNLLGIAMFGKRLLCSQLSKAKSLDSKYFMEQMLLSKKDEAGVIFSNKQNDFLLADAVQWKSLRSWVQTYA